MNRYIFFLILFLRLYLASAINYHIQPNGSDSNDGLSFTKAFKTIQVATNKAKAGDSIWQIFSVYHLPNTTDYLATSFKDRNEFNSFIKLIKNRSVFVFGIDINEDDKIITLSTCYRLNDRMVMHGKLIK